MKTFKLFNFNRRTAMVQADGCTAARQKIGVNPRTTSIIGRFASVLCIILIMLLTLGVGQMWGAAKQRYIYVGISNNYQTWKDSNKFRLHIWGGTDGDCLKELTWITDTYSWDNHNYAIYRVLIYDDTPNFQFKAKDDWWSGTIEKVSISGTTKNAVFFLDGADNSDSAANFQTNYQVESEATLSGSSSVAVGTNVTLTPSLSSNATYNEIKSTSYSVTTNPGGGGSVTSAGVFSATKTGTYTVTATITYNAKDFSGITKTATATRTITVMGTPSVSLTVDKVNVNQITLTGTITNYNNSGSSASDMSEVGFYIGETKYTATYKSGSTFKKTITGLSANTAYANVKAFAKNAVSQTGNSSTQTVTTLADATYRVKVRVAHGATAPKVYAWTDADGYGGVGMANGTYGSQSAISSLATGTTYDWYYCDLNNCYEKFLIYQTGDANKTDDIAATRTSDCFWYNAGAASQGDRKGKMDCPIFEPNVYIETTASSGSYTYEEMSTSPTISKTLTLAAKSTYKFKILYNAEYYGKASTTITRGSNSASSLAVDGAYINLKTDAAGDYTFTYTPGTKTIAVTYQTAYTVTFGKGTGGNTISASATSAGGTLTSGDYVASGDNVTFTQTANKGYTFAGWYDASTGGSAVSGMSTSDNVLDAISANAKVYSRYTEDMHTVTLANNGHGHVEIGGETVTSGSAGITTSVTITAVPDAGYHFVNWTKTDATVTLGSTTSVSTTMKATADSKTVTANFEADKYIYFDNTYTKWSKVYVYLFNNNVWYDNKDGDDGPGVKPNHSNRVAFAEMTKVKGTTNLYEYAYHTPSVNYTFSHVAFCKDNQSTYNAFYNTDAVYRNDWDDKLRVYVAPAGYTTPLINGTKYHGDKNNNAGYWRVYNPKAGDNAYYYLDQFCAHGSTFPDGQYFKASGDGALVAEISARLTSASTDYSFGVHSAGTTNLHFATSHTFTVDDSEDIKLYKYNSDWNFTLKTTSEGIYTFVLSMEHDSLRLSVIYPASVNDYRIKFTENGKSHYSDIIKKKTADAGVVTTSMYINKDGTSPSLKLEQCTSITAGVPTWTERKDFGFTGFGSKGVYVMDLTVSGTNGISSTLSNISAYSGPYYIKTDGASGGWQNYKQNVMDENSLNFDAEHPDKSFNYYYCKYYNSAGTNLKCVIANDYCNALTDTLKGDAVIGVGNQTTPSAANVRFSYNSYTNEINRSYLGSSVASDFLRILGNTTAGQPHIYAKDEGSPGDATAKEYIKFEDKQNWRYEIDVKANINARAKLTATFNGQTQYFWGAAGDFSVANTELLFGGSGSGTYGLTLVYDFKTNKLITAWKPTGTISDDLTLNSDIILLREHQGTPTTITFGLKDEEDPSSYASLSEVKTVYSVLRFNRWKLSNRAHPEDLDTRHCDDGVSDYNTYHRQLEVNQDDENGKWLPQAERELYFISFPFDVKMSDIIHFGGYYNTWGIMYYDGKGRAKNGYWIDSESNWKYFTPEEFATGTLKAYEGYIIGIDLAIMAYNNTSFWTNNSSEVDIYFPSKTAVSTITQQTVTVKIDTVGYECTINRTVGGDDGDRRIKDSHWHCIGVPAYASVSQTTHTNEPDENTNWKTDDMLYVYSWRPSTNDHVIADAGTFTFNAMYAYLVQYSQPTLSWSAAAVSPSSIAARRMKTEELRDRQFNLQLLQGDKEADHTYIRLSDDEEVTTGFEFNHDVSKMMLSGANIYTLIGKEQAAANSLPLNLEQTTTVPVGVKIATNGDYTFSISEGTQGVGVTLIDNETGSRTNLSALDYEISLEEGTYDERFMLEISPIMHTPTSVEGITGDESNVTNARKVMIDGLLYIVKDGVIYDARGAVVK